MQWKLIISAQLHALSVLIAVCALALISATKAHAEKRVALVIGNAAYRNLTPLINPARDAKEIAALLGDHGFRVTKRTDLTLGQFYETLSDFRAEARDADVVLVYYAGHGMQLDNVDVLAPIDLEYECARDGIGLTHKRSLPLEELLNGLGGAASKTVILVDACRNAPFQHCQTRGASGFGFRGLARPGIQGRAITIFNATVPGGLAEEGQPGVGSPFARILLTQVRRHPDQPIRDVLDLTAKAVQTETSGSQVPELIIRGGAPLFCIGVCRNTASIAPPTPPPPKRTVSRKETKALKDGEKFKECQECPQLVVVPAGKFEMGSPKEEVGHDATEGPIRTVVIQRRFAIGTHEVKNSEFVVFLNEKTNEGGVDDRWTGYLQNGQETAIKRTGTAGTLYVVEKGRENHPATHVSWPGATAYAEWLSRLIGAQYRLPTEAEWEYAARASSSHPWFFGTEALQICEYANIADQSLLKALGSGTTTKCDDGYSDLGPVGKFKPNKLGLFDVYGNVAEWTEDCWHDTYIGAPTNGSAWTQGGECSSRVLRGGSFHNLHHGARSAQRFKNSQFDRFQTIGFRVARTLLP